jgi:hypothetical protein
LDTKRKNTVVFTKSVSKALDLFGAENDFGMSMDSFGKTSLIGKKSLDSSLAPLIERKSSLDLFGKTSVIGKKSLDSSLAPLIERKSSLDLFGKTSVIERKYGDETWYGYMQDNIDDVHIHIESSEEDDDWIQSIWRRSVVVSQSN